MKQNINRRKAISSAGIERVETPNIMLGLSPERDRKIEKTNYDRINY